MAHTISSVRSLEILDSRGFPTVETEITFASGAVGRAAVPSGASTGEREACELRDGDKKRYNGKGVQKAVSHVNGEIAKLVVGRTFGGQRDLDRALIELDGTPNKTKLGANAILSVSMAFARASAAAAGTPLFAYLGGANAHILPVPCMNVINGGKHADNNVDFQEFMIAPHKAPSFAEAIRMGSEVFQALKSVLKGKGYSTGVGDEGGFAPDLKSNDEAVESILAGIEKAGFKPGEEVSICLDPAASELWEEGKYVLFKSTKKALSSAELIALWEKWVKQYPIILIEDGLAENDWAGWAELTKRLGGKIELVGDDIFCTNRKILEKGIAEGVANAVLIKLNQIGTVTETLETIETAYRNHYNCFVSHRSGETVDPFIADLTVAVNAGHLKTGSGCRGERIEKFNQLMRIERELGSAAVFAGKGAFKNAR